MTHAEFWKADSAINEVRVRNMTLAELLSRPDDDFARAELARRERALAGVQATVAEHSRRIGNLEAWRSIATAELTSIRALLAGLPTRIELSAWFAEVLAEIRAAAKGNNAKRA